MYCKRCGSLLNEGENFCSKCGESRNNVEESEKKKSPIALILIIVFIIVIGFGTLVFLGFRALINRSSSIISNIDNTKNIIEDKIKDDIKKDINKINDSEEDKIKFDSYEVKKLSGYTYSETSSSLTVSNSKFSCLITVISSYNQSLDMLIEQNDIVKDTFNSSGMDIINDETIKYDNNTFLTYEISYLNQNMIVFYTQKNEGKFLYGVVTFTKEKDKKVMDDINKIFDNITYIGE